MADRVSDQDMPPTGQAGFAAAEEQRLEASLSVSASERLRWLEEALAFAARFRVETGPEQSTAGPPAGPAGPDSPSRDQ